MSPFDIDTPSKWVCTYCDNSWPTFTQVKAHMTVCREKLRLDEKYKDPEGDSL